MRFAYSLLMNRLRLQGSEMIIATPYAFAGYHIAEAMGKTPSTQRSVKAHSQDLTLPSVPPPPPPPTGPACPAGIPFVYVCPFPWTRTRAFPQPLITPETSLGGTGPRAALFLSPHLS